MSISGISQNDDISPGEMASYGLATNQNHGVYRRGLPYDVAAKLRVASALRRTTSNINVSATARECGVSTWFVRKIRDEMIANGGGVVDPRTLKQGRVYGPGVKTFDEVDQTVLLYLYIEQPYRSNSSYADNLYAITGTVASPSTISRWFNHGFPISGGFRKPNLIPLDKFKPENLWRAEEYLYALERIAPHRLRFGDEKLIKGAEVYCRRTRRNVLDGTVPAIITPSDFRNTYAVFGMCGINEDTPPLYWRIHNSNNDAIEFAYDIEQALCIGYLAYNDVVVLDNAIIHSGGSNKYLADFCWRHFQVFILFLPTRLPEWNPQELVWKDMVCDTKKVPIKVLRRVEKHSSA